MIFDSKIIAKFTTLTKKQFLRKKEKDKVDIIHGAYLACEEADEKMVRRLKALELKCKNHPKDKKKFEKEILRIKKEIKVIRHEGQILQDLFEGHVLKNNTVFKDYADRYLRD
ncbi:MAG: hypothetical protein DRP06_01675 [Candidatus Aenigmatarchaeota archaeon]|nr:MAG: hypothetical protein DRP06_01675 [Candidatus Aenigmarchaeota archaeon]